ncbi:cell wall hydrolase [Altererythrobacter sp. MF3-039]|uniref:cell wall hydrolase n=1 Tax=Altererythrobacter sp. MF3-039 TaxID=3252901 RepID=UPI00390C4800
MRKLRDILASLHESADGGGRRPLMPSAVVGILAASAAGGIWLVDNRAEAAAEVERAAKQQAEMVALNTVNEGEGALLVLQGESAQARNSRIPMAAGSLERISAVSGLPQSGQEYDTALKCMTQAVYYEAANEPTQGKRAVAQVILNRMRHSAYPNSVCGVVYEGSNQRVCQFSFTCDGSLLRRPMATKWQKSREVALAALAGRTEQSVGTATHYHADYVLPRWAFKLGKLEKIGLHIFYRFKGNWGSSEAFNRRWSGRETIPALDFERLRRRLAANVEMLPPEPEFVPGLTVVRDVTDRHADHDVGGRIDTTKAWRPSIPDPVTASSSYRATLGNHGADASLESGEMAEQQS